MSINVGPDPDAGAGVTSYERTEVNDADYIVTSGDYLIAVIALTAPHTINLPDTLLLLGTAAEPREFTVKDESGSAGAFPITILPQTPTIDGVPSVSIVTNFGAYTFYTDGVAWFTR